MLKEILPPEISNLIYSRFNFNGIYEMRIRRDKPLYINYYGEYISLKDKFQNPIFADKKLIEYVINQTTKMSIYRYNNQIKQGFITTEKGVRIGLAGEVVTEESGEVKTIKNLNGLVIRVPHEIKNCASGILPYVVVDGEVLNTLIISPPGCGKTTLIRDLSRLLCLEEKIYNILVVDERYEIAGAENGEAKMDVGSTCDVISGGSKEFAFGGGIRSLKPDVIITDEIGSSLDVKAISKARLSGVKVIATAHAKNEEDLKKQASFKEMLKEKLFDRIVVLSSKRGMGVVECILNADFEPIVVL